MLINESKLVSLPNVLNSPHAQTLHLPCRNSNIGNIRINEIALSISQVERLSSPNRAESIEAQISPVSRHRGENHSINLELDLIIRNSKTLSSLCALESAQTRIPSLSRKSDENECIKPGPGSPFN